MIPVYFHNLPPKKKTLMMDTAEDGEANPSKPQLDNTHGCQVAVKFDGELDGVNVSCSKSNKKKNKIK